MGITGRAALVRLIVLALLWGSSFLWASLALEGLPPGVLTVVRLALGSALLLTVCRIRRIRLPTDTRTWTHLFVVAAIGNVLPLLLFAFAVRSIDSHVGGMLNATTPLWTLIIGVCTGATPLFRRASQLAPCGAGGAEEEGAAVVVDETSTPRKRFRRAWEAQQVGWRYLAGLIAGLAGTLLVASPWAPSTALPLGPTLLGLGAAASYGAGYVYIDRYLARTGHHPAAIAAGQLLAGLFLASATLPVTGPLSPEGVKITPVVVLATVVLGCLCTAFATMLNIKQIADVGQAASVVLYLLPIVAVLLGWAVLGESVSLVTMIGTGVVLAGVALTRSPRPRVSSARRSQGSELPRARRRPA